ncbi:general secretion pathway protein GspE [Candidatus Thiomargarita nelsonii]|uniref:General secretion pathway protein GspE n=1 Tax=Candidatus Thiomargarita nelsonii TaxID=1003181 RepID=A0A4E0RPK6_9GAMM|nr:general secretion pathway protein GspE [Candidatus Thiomargarita nelsonii]
MTPQKLTPPLTGFPFKIVSLGLLSEHDARMAIDESRCEHISFVTYLLNKNLVEQHSIAWALSQEFGIPMIDIESIEFNPELINLLNEKLLVKHQSLPLFKRGKCLFVAVSNPTDVEALKEIQFHTKTQIEPIIAEADKLAKMIEDALVFISSDEVLEKIEIVDNDEQVVDNDEQKPAGETKIVSEVEAPFVKFVNSMLFKAIIMGASDLHFEPYEKFYQVRLRIDGVLRVIAKPPLAISQKLAAHIKLMSRLEVSKLHAPQQGRIKLKISATKAIDFRVITCPTLWGEKIVMRIIDSSITKLNINKLGFDEEQKSLYLEALAKQHGMILVTGPTGSGKTVSLYTGLNIFNKESVNMATIENQVEIPLPGINQVQVDEKNGTTFAEAIRTFIAQETDIFLVGEIPDIETCKLAINAALKGHLVLSSLYTNDAPQTLSYLTGMGIPPFTLASAINLIIAQRLCRRLCSCKIEQNLSEQSLLSAGFKKAEMPKMKLYGPKLGGCDKCGGSGYRGRVGIYQVMPVSEEMKCLLMDGCNGMAFAGQASREGIADLRESGLKKLKEGLISLEELNRVISS